MNNSIKRQEHSINRIQILSGVLLFLIGALVYIIDRPPEDTYFFTHFNFIKTLHNIVPPMFGAVGNYLPDFIHPLSFILVTAGIICRTKKGYIISCTAWFFIDCIFELGQKYNELFMKAVPNRFLEFPLLKGLENYFRKGTFDPLDIAAIFAGTIAAYVILVLTMKKEK